MSLIPNALLTPHGAWHEPSTILFGFGKQTVREKRAGTAWLRKIGRILNMYPAHLAMQKVHGPDPLADDRRYRPPVMLSDRHIETTNARCVAE
jgi:hypothetical protein